ncbi:hypothetical protein Taro_007245 [Colocasia esculenta]|uniref:Glycosyltransferase subfamily 4-like N-terminal domain-containing protein n=1 Tax=Colocasia esculenta TaxID=4460 RepID=A0A843TZ74_COLES|nr:hypothetical protein [Colocasia esculenta]
MATMNNGRSKRAAMPSITPLQAILLGVLVIVLPALVVLSPSRLPLASCNSANVGRTSAGRGGRPWSGDLRRAEFSWNRLHFTEKTPPPQTLKIAVFSRKWPVNSAPGGMERHALTLHTALASRGHQVHVFTSGVAGVDGKSAAGGGDGSPRVHFLGGTPGQWRSNEAWSMYKAEDDREAFDVVHSESVALPHNLARDVPNLAVSWHGIALEALQSNIYQALAQGPDEPISPALNQSLFGQPLKVVGEIKFFKSYTHHIAISDSSGEMLRDVYQIPPGRVHVILNGVDDEEFGVDEALGRAFREEIGVPRNATLVMGVAGRLVRDKGHPLLHEALPKFLSRHPGVYLVVAGSGPWAARYAELGPQVLALGSMPPSRLRAFYNAVDVFVNPTLRPQGLDLTLMEAMQSGTPVLATRFPSIKGTVVVEEEFGIMFAPNAESLEDALESAVGEGPRRMAERGRACREYAAAMFTARKMAAAYERLFLCIKNETYCAYPLPFDSQA